MKKALSADTSLAAEAVMLDIYRRMPPRRKAAVVRDAITTGRVLAMAGLRARYPQDSEAKLRRRPQELAENRSIPVKSAEDTVLRKLWWYRDGGEVSDRQWGDVMGILRSQEDRLDRAYLARWAEFLGVRDLLERALDDS